jgi:hypothetical protein
MAEKQSRRKLQEISMIEDGMGDDRIDEGETGIDESEDEDHLTLVLTLTHHY